VEGDYIETSKKSGTKSPGREGPEKKKGGLDAAGINLGEGGSRPQSRKVKHETKQGTGRGI